MWAHSHSHLWFWQRIRTRPAVHWVEQEVFAISTFLIFEERVLAGLRLCRFLFTCFCFLAHLWRDLFFLQGEQNLGISSCVLFFVFDLFSLPSTVKYYHSCLWLDERSRPLFWFDGYVFRTNFMEAFLHVSLSMYEIKDNMWTNIDG